MLRGLECCAVSRMGVYPLRSKPQVTSEVYTHSADLFPSLRHHPLPKSTAQFQVVGRVQTTRSTLCAPPGYPQSAVSRIKTRLPSLPRLQRHWSELFPLARLTTAQAASLQCARSESAARLNLPSQVRAEGVERNGAFSGSRPTEGTPQGRVYKTVSSGTPPTALAQHDRFR